MVQYSVTFLINLFDSLDAPFQRNTISSRFVYFDNRLDWIYNFNLGLCRILQVRSDVNIKEIKLRECELDENKLNYV